MRNLFIVLLVALTIVSCQKNEPEMATLQEVSFEAINIDPGTLKSGGGEFDCPKDGQGNYLVPTVAKVVIAATPNDLEFWPALFELDGKLYTQAIKLPVGTYTVKQFGLYTAVNGTLVMATPATGSDFAVYTNPDVTFTFDVTKFAKAQIPVQVLCFIPDQVTSFGFDWFQVTEIIVREQCFFGDLCITNTEAFNYTPYNMGGVMPDEEAYIKVVVKRNGTEVPNSPFIDTYGDGKPLCVQYPDYLGSVDNYTFELYVYVPTTTPGIFDWQLYGTFTATDALPIAEAGTDGVVDFAIGTCSPNSYPIYTWLPAPPPPPQTSNWETFYIRNHNGTITAPWDTDIVLTENAGGDGFSAATPQGGQKVGYGTSFFDGVKVNTIDEVNFIKLSGSPNSPIPYLNFWVTDGINYAVIACGATDYRGQDLGTINEWPVYEYNTAIDLDWLFDSGDGSVGPNWSGHQLMYNGNPATLNDLGNDIVLFQGPIPYNFPGIGTGAPRGGYGFNIIFGDTQSNYIGSYQIGSLSVKVNGITYNATN